MKSNFDTRLQNATSLADIFEVVKAAVLESDKKSRSGLMLGLADFGYKHHSDEQNSSQADQAD
jgi:hypothetical protein